MRRVPGFLALAAVLLLALLLPAAALPLEVTEQRTLRVDDTMTVILPLDSGLQAWRLLGADPTVLEMREQAVTPFTYVLTVAGIAGGEARLVLHKAFTVPPETVLEQRTIRIRVIGPLATAIPAAANVPAVDTVPVVTPVAVSDTVAADTRLLTLYRLLRQHHGDTPTAAPAPTAPAPVTAGTAVTSTAAPPAAAVPTPVRRRPRAEWVTSAELVDGKPRRELLSTVAGWLGVADELYQAGFFDRAQQEYERAAAFSLPVEQQARAQGSIAECRYHQGDQGGAISRFREMLAMPANSWQPRARLRLGQLLLESGEVSDAIREFIYLRAGGNALARDAQFHLAQCYARLLRYDEALAELQRAASHETRPDWRARISYETAKIYDYVPALRDYYRALSYYRLVNTGEYEQAAATRARTIEEEYL